MRKTYKPFGNTLFLAVLGTLSLFISACGGKKAPEHTKLIPQDVAFVVRLDLKQLTGKTISLDKLVSKENLKEMGASEKGAEKASQGVKKFLNSGIDFLNKVYIFSNTEDASKGNAEVGIVFAIDNEDKLTKFVKDDATWKEIKDVKKPEFKEEGKIKFAVFEKDAVLAWQGKAGVFYTNKKGVSTADVKKLFELKDNETLIGSNESFKEAVGQSYDATVWFNIEKLSASNAQAAMVMGATGVNNKGTAFALGFTFEKGKILVNADYTGNEEINKLNDKIANESVKGGILKNIPIDQASAGFSFSLNLEGLSGYLKEKGLLGEVEGSLKEFGLTADDITKAISGDVFGVVGKVNFDGKSNDVPEFVISIGLKDKKAFEKVLDAVNSKQKGALSKKDNVYEIAGGMGFLVVKDDAAYITMNAGIKEGINKGDSKLKGELKEQATKNASVVYADKNLSDAWVSSKAYKETSFGKVFGDKFPFEGGIAKIGKMKNKRAKTEIEISMRDKGQNSLLVLIEMGKKMSEVDKLEREKYERDFNFDSSENDKEEVPVIEEK
jgi:hypothetical protein